MNLINRAKLRYINVYQFELINFIKTTHGYDSKFYHEEQHMEFPKFKIPVGMFEDEAFKILAFMYKDAFEKLCEELGQDKVTEKIVLQCVIAKLEDAGFEVLGKTNHQVKKLYKYVGTYNKKDIRKYKAEGCNWETNFTDKEVKHICARYKIQLPKMENMDTQADYVIREFSK